MATSDAPRVELHLITPDEARRIVDGTPLAGDRWHPQYPLADELDVLRPLAAEQPGVPSPDLVFELMMIRVVRAVRASTDPANLPSSRVLERAGFRELAPSHGMQQFERVLAT